jgi:hypothetical protein
MTVTVPPMPPPDAMAARTTGLGATSAPGAPRLNTTFAPPPLPAKSSSQQTLALVAVMVLMLAGIGVGIWFWLNPIPTPAPDPDLNANKDTKKTVQVAQTTTKTLEELRVYKTPKDMVDAIQDDLLAVLSEKRKQQRYFTLVHLHNNINVSKAEIDNYRKALHDLVKHLSGPEDLSKVLVAVDKDQLIYRVDLEEAGWKIPNWRVAATLYPYGLNLDKVPYVSEAYNTIYDLTRDPVAWIYTDWFVAAASDPDSKLYSKLHVSKKDDPLPESIAKLAESYRNQPVTLEIATTELGLSVKDTPRVKNTVENSTKVKNLGLQALAEGKTIPRSEWTAMDKAGFATAYQALAGEMYLGASIRISN